MRRNKIRNSARNMCPKIRLFLLLFFVNRPIFCPICPWRICRTHFWPANTFTASFVPRSSFGGIIWRDLKLNGAMWPKLRFNVSAICRPAPNLVSDDAIEDLCVLSLSLVGFERIHKWRCDLTCDVCCYSFRLSWTHPTAVNKSSCLTFANSTGLNCLKSKKMNDLYFVYYWLQSCTY